MQSLSCFAQSDLAMLFVVLLLATALLLYFLLDEILSSIHLPPGPFPLPIIGNIHLLSDKAYLDLYQLACHYGPVYRLRMGFTRAVVINSYSFAKEAMVKKGSDFAGRPPHFAGSLFSRGGKGVGFQTYTRKLRLQRKAIIQTIRNFEKDAKLEDIVIVELGELISRLDNKTNKNTVDENSCRNEAVSSVSLRQDISDAENHIVASLTFGESFSKERHQDFSQIVNILGVFAETLAATTTVNTFPLLRYIPFKITQKLKEACKVRDKIFDAIFMERKEQFLNKNAHEIRDLADALLEMADKSRGHPEEELTDDYIAMTINDTIIAGSESPASTFCWIIYFLVKYPDMQRRIQEEIDDVIGRQLPPKWSDRQQLPYLEAFTTECMRIASAMPLAIPHQATVDTSLGPYKIPKDTTVILNIYAIHRDPEIWQNPHDFNPDRFLNHDGTFDVDKASKCVVFGIGHRVCPGELLSRMEVFLFTSNIVQKFTFTCRNRPLLGIEDGKYGLVFRSPEFKVTIKKRP